MGLDRGMPEMNAPLTNGSQQNELNVLEFARSTADVLALVGNPGRSEWPGRPVAPIEGDAP